MRDYATISAKFWIGETGRTLRGNADAQRLCFYLMTCPSSTMIGLYYLPLPTLCHELGISMEGASKALRRVNEVGFASYDTVTEWVWVHEMARHQIGESLSPNDNRVKNVNKLFSECLNCSFANEFYSRYGEVFHLEKPKCRGQKPVPPQAPSKPLRSQEQEQEQEQDTEPEKEESSEPAKLPAEPTTGATDPGTPKIVPPSVPRQGIYPEPPDGTVLTFDCNGHTKVWHLVQGQVEAWSESYPGVDVMQEMRKAFEWSKASPRSRKTASGMMKFLVSWLNRANDDWSGGNERRQGGFGGNPRRGAAAIGPGQRYDPAGAAKRGVNDI